MEVKNKQNLSDLTCFFSLVKPSCLSPKTKYEKSKKYKQFNKANKLDGGGGGPIFWTFNFEESNLNDLRLPPNLGHSPSQPAQPLLLVGPILDHHHIYVSLILS